MIRFFGGILMRHYGVFNPLVVGEKVIKGAVPEMGSPGGVGKILILVGYINTGGNGTSVCGIKRIQPVLFRLIVATLLVHRIIAFAVI